MRSDSKPWTHDVFISYRSSRSPDREIAEQLQNTLEAYPVPSSLGRALVRPARYPFLPSRLRVFRDNSDLSATPDLWQAIRRELLQSRWLVVVCSPGTSQSPWIAKEIATFLEVNGRDRVIAVLVEGEPDDSIPAQLRSDVEHGAGSGTPHTQSAAPRASDLRAADVRSAVALLDGWRTPRIRQKRFDVLAPILGLSSRDDLVQRHRAGVRRRLGSLILAVLLVVTTGAYLKNRVDLAEARAEQEKEEREAEQRARELAEAATQASKQEVGAVRAEVTQVTNEFEKAKQEVSAVREDNRDEIARRHESQARTDRFTNPFNAAAEAFTALQARSLESSTSVLNAIHAVLLKRREMSIQEREIVRHGTFSYASQSGPGERYSSFSRDGSRALVIGEPKGDRGSPESAGAVSVLNLGTMQSVPLTSCGAEAERLEFAEFVDLDKVLVARGFYVGIYSVTGECLRRFQMRATKTSITAAGGLLHETFFVAGNGTGCVWVEDYRGSGRWLVEPSAELGVVEDCDGKNGPNAVTQVLTNSAGNRGILVFQSGRVNLFGLDGTNRRPKRRPIVAHGAQAVAFQSGTAQSHFAIAYRDPAGGPQRLELWNADGKKSASVKSFSLDGVDRAVDYLGFSSDGALLIGIDASCALHYWDVRTGTHLRERPAMDLPACQPATTGKVSTDSPAV